MFVLRHKYIFYAISAALVGISVAMLSLGWLRAGIDFTGGSMLEGSWEGERPALSLVREAVSSAVAGEVEARAVGESGILVRMRDVSEEEHQNILVALESLGAFREDHFSSIGPSIGREVRRLAVVAVAVTVAVILGFVAWAFRRSGGAVSPWTFGSAAIIALIHDVTIVMGVFALLGRLRGVEVDASIVAAILTTLGYSVNDTIVVFDRVRERLARSAGMPFANVVGSSLRQTAGRSVNTSFTTVLVLLAIVFFGGPTVHSFALALTVGIIAGTYSSIFLASPLLVAWARQK